MKNVKPVRIAVIGIGDRATELMRTMIATKDLSIRILCDPLDARLEDGCRVLDEAQLPRPQLVHDYRDALLPGEIDAAIVATSWNEHVEITLEAMRRGIPCGFEVGGASSLDECWELVRTWERTKTPCMMLENCCYGRYELAVLQMIREGLLGEIVHCEGGYQHELGPNTVRLANVGHQRSFHHMHRNGDLYPTHEIGPISKYLQINRGNRFVTVSSVASKCVALNKIAQRAYGDGKEKFMLGDFVTTLLRCANGETVVIRYDTSLPRPYTRSNAVHGTKGVWMELNHSIYIDGVSPAHQWEDVQPYVEKYEHPLWRDFLKEGVQGGHDGMDYLLMKAFAWSVHNGKPFPLDIYDAATWMAVTVLSEQSVSLAGAPLPFPDFTNGKWVMREEENKTQYSI